jgi:hypothetical protein
VGFLCGNTREKRFEIVDMFNKEVHIRYLEFSKTFYAKAKNLTNEAKNWRVVKKVRLNSFCITYGDSSAFSLNELDF